MSVPQTNFSPPFNTTRASHIALTVRDLSVSRSFYTEVIGLLVTHEAGDEVYLRGVEETCHHSLILRKSVGRPLCEVIGYRVFQESDLDRAKQHFERSGVASEWIDRPFQGRTLRLRDAAGIPIEFCASMPTLPRLHDRPHLQRGAAALRYDHVQCLVPDVSAAGQFYADLGFRISDYFVDKPEDDSPLGLFMFRKNNPHDIVFLTRPGPQMHHFGYVVSEPGQLFRALDTAGAIGFERISSAAPAAMAKGTYFTSISATPMDTASKYCRRRSRSSISTTSRRAGTAAIVSPGISRRRRNGCMRQLHFVTLPWSSPAWRRNCFRSRITSAA